MLEITPEDIQALDDTELRELIGRLCEADYRAQQLATSGIHYGGHQKAADGGVDVMVSGPEPPSTSFIKRVPTGIQVKAEKKGMPPGKILSEMKPGGELRRCIIDLIEKAGAYIIVSSGDSCSKTMHQDRIDAMHEAIVECTDHKSLLLDFYDRNRVATWVRDHPSLILWVREKVERLINGWKAYENWSNPAAGIDEPYYCDDTLRLVDGTNSQRESSSVVDGMSQLRETLLSPRSSIRLTGLSGVGKTRLVQALFDDRIGKNALDPTRVFYTDIECGPNPAPQAFAAQLIALQQACFLVVDNCPPTMHEQLTKIVTSHNSLVSLLTVEYDIRDDLPEETQVYRLQPASNETTVHIIQKQYPHINLVNARSIAEHSGGNARIAIALARTVEQGETLSAFNHDTLFKRLFQQRHDPNKDLLTTAEVLSLVYSFDGENTQGNTSELAILASLANTNVDNLYREISELKRRDLIQSRSIWRALLPHAIANWLAKRALENIPKEKLSSTILKSDSERLIQSFSRRLGYLHDSDQAIAVVTHWLRNDGWIGKHISNLNQFGFVVLENIAPVCPELTLSAIESAANQMNNNDFFNSQNPHITGFVRLLKKIAFERAFFNRCVQLLIAFTLSAKEDFKNSYAGDSLACLFQIKLSGTHATIDDRVQIIESLVSSNDDAKVNLGFYLLRHALQTSHFSSSHNFDFGARPRDYGYYPKTQADVEQWYQNFIGIAVDAAKSNKPESSLAKKTLAKGLRGLWSTAELHDLVEITARDIHQYTHWNEGWVAIKNIFRFDGKHLTQENKNTLSTLENLLKPTDLLEQARTYALADDHLSFGLENNNGDEEGWRQAEETARKLGMQVANDQKILKTLVPELLLASNHNHRLLYFSQGLAQGATNKKVLWQELYQHFEKIPEDKRNRIVLIRFLSSTQQLDPKFYNETMDKLIHDPLLGPIFPYFQSDTLMDGVALKRLHQSLEIGLVDITSYRSLAWDRSHEVLSDEELITFLEKLSQQEDGYSVVIEILKQRFYQGKNDDHQHSEALIKFSCQALAECSFNKKNQIVNSLDFSLSSIAKVCFKRNTSRKYSRKICQNITQAIKSYQIYAFDISEFLNDLADFFPEDFLNTFIEDKPLSGLTGFDGMEASENPVNSISNQHIITWCVKKPNERIPALTRLATPFANNPETGTLEWKPYIEHFINALDDLTCFCKALDDALIPKSWGSDNPRSKLLTERLTLLKMLSTHKRHEINQWAKEKSIQFEKQIKIDEENELHQRRRENESFE